MNIHPFRTADDPAADEALAALLRASTPSSRPGPLPGEEGALAAFRAAGHAPGRPSMQTTRTRARVLIATTATAGMLACTGAAAAATGSLPGAAQQTARDMLAKVGVSVPGPDSHSAGHADTRGDSDATDATPEATPEQPQSSAHPDAHGKGAEISQLARTTTATGVAKGAEISTLASGGKSQAGQHGKPTAPASPSVTHKPTAPGSQGKAHKPAAPGSQGTVNKPTAPGSQGTAHKPSGAGSQGAGTSGSNRP